MFTRSFVSAQFWYVSNRRMGRKFDQFSKSSQHGHPRSLFWQISTWTWWNKVIIIVLNNDILARHELKNDIEKPTKYSATLIIYVISSITKNFKTRHPTMSNYQWSWCLIHLFQYKGNLIWTLYKIIRSYKTFDMEKYISDVWTHSSSVFDQLVGSALKGLRHSKSQTRTLKHCSTEEYYPQNAPKKYWKSFTKDFTQVREE